MLGWLRTHRRLDAGEAARVLASVRVLKDRERVRAMANQLRADMRAKGRANLPDIDWNA